MAVHTFLKRLIDDHIKPFYQNIEKMNYFSDESCAQYKNYKNFVNLVHHKQDFGITAEWNFYATSHGKNSCDGVGGAVKRLATRASLQRPLDDQILTPHQLFEFTRHNIAGLTSFFIDSDTVKSTGETLEARFSHAERIKGTRNHHQFIPEDDSIRMYCVSGSTNHFISAVNNNRTMLLKDITPGSYYACKYDNKIYYCIVNYVSTEYVSVKFMLQSSFGQIEKMCAGCHLIKCCAELSHPHLEEQQGFIVLVLMILIESKDFCNVFNAFLNSDHAL